MARTAQLGTPNVKSFTNCDATVSSALAGLARRVVVFSVLSVMVFFSDGDSGLRFLLCLYFERILNKEC